MGCTGVIVVVQTGGILTAGPEHGVAPDSVGSGIASVTLQVSPGTTGTVTWVDHGLLKTVVFAQGCAAIVIGFLTGVVVVGGQYTFAVNVSGLLMLIFCPVSLSIFLITCSVAVGVQRSV